MRAFVSAVAALVLSATASFATTFNVFAVPSNSLLGTFSAPPGGGALDAASIAFGDGVFDLLLGGNDAPVYDAVNNWVTASGGSGFGGISNSVSFDTVGVDDEPITCGIGECLFLMTSGSGAPPEFSVDFCPAGACAVNIGVGNYLVAPIPLPPAGILFIGALAGMAWLGRRSSNRQRGSVR